MTPAYLITLAKWGMNLAFWSAAGFVVLIGCVWPWWRSFWGMNIVTLEVAIMLALLGSIISVDFNSNVSDNLWFAWLTVSALWLVGVIIVWRGLLVVTEQIRGAYGINIWRVVGQRVRRAAQRLLRRDQRPAPAGDDEPVRECDSSK